MRGLTILRTFTVSSPPRESRGEHRRRRRARTCSLARKSAPPAAGCAYAETIGRKETLSVRHVEISFVWSPGRRRPSKLLQASGMNAAGQDCPPQPRDPEGLTRPLALLGFLSLPDLLLDLGRAHGPEPKYWDRFSTKQLTPHPVTPLTCARRPQTHGAKAGYAPSPRVPGLLLTSPGWPFVGNLPKEALGRVFGKEEEGGGGG